MIENICCLIVSRFALARTFTNKIHKRKQQQQQNRYTLLPNLYFDLKYLVHMWVGIVNVNWGQEGSPLLVKNQLPSMDSAVCSDDLQVLRQNFSVCGRILRKVRTLFGKTSRKLILNYFKGQKIRGLCLKIYIV